MSEPFCAITPPQPATEPTGPVFAAIPVATDLPSAIAAVNAMRGAFMTLTNQITNNNTTTQPTILPPSPPKPKTNNNNKKQNNNNNFIELKRSTQKVRIFNPDDNEQFVDVEQITSLTLKDQATGQTWVWSL